MKIVFDNGEEIPFEKIKVLNVKDGDIIVLESKCIYSDRVTENIRSSFKELTGIKCIILEESLHVSAILKKINE